MIRRYPFASFVALAFLITWSCHIASILLATRAGISLSNEVNFNHLTAFVNGILNTDRLFAFLVYNLGQFGPMLSAFVITAIIYGRIGVRNLAARMLKWRISLRWYLVALALPLLLGVVSLAATLVASGFKLGPFVPQVAWVLFAPFLIYMMVFNGLAEEPGWRGFALAHLQISHTAIRSSWILGIVWGAWHIPFTVYFNREQLVLLVPALAALLLGITGWTIVLTWLYNNTESVLLMILLHGWDNTVRSYLILSQPHPLAWSLYFIVPWIIAAYISRRYGEKRLGYASPT